MICMTIGSISKLIEIKLASTTYNNTCRINTFTRAIKEYVSI